jgi:lambda family phage tail tape measure protein
MANMIARLGVLLGIDSAEFVRGIDGASKKLEQFGQTAVKVTAVAASALTVATIAAVRFADEITDIAKANDVAIDSVVKLRQALQDNGGEADNAGKMLSSFTGFVDKAADGGLDAQKTMSRLGVSLKEIGTLTIDELQNKFLVALQNIEDPITRNAMAMEIFGKAAKGVDFAEMANSIQNSTDVTRQQAAAIQKAADVVGVFEKSWRDLMLMLSSEVGAPLSQTISYMKSLQGETQIFGKIFEQTFKGVAAIAMSAAFAMDRFYDALFGKENYQERSAQKFNELKQQLSDLYRGDDLRRGLDDPRIIKSESGGPLRGTVLAKNPEDERLKREADREAKRIRENDIKIGEIINRQIDERLKEEKKLRDEEIKLGEIRNRQVETYLKTNQQIKERQTLESLSLDRQKTMFEYEQETRLLREKDKQLFIDVFNIRANQEDKIRAIQQESNLLEADREERIERENQLAAKAIELARERNRVMREMQEGDEQKGALKRAEEFFAFVPTAMENGAQMFDSVMGNMTAALDNFVTSGKLSFKDLTRSILQDLLRIQLRAQMLSMFKGMFGNMFGGGFGTGNAFGNLDLGGFLAEGGPANANTPYVVGERGPELFIPKASGMVIPNNQLSSAMGSTTTVNNNYINAIDAKSFENRLLESSNTIWAGYQYANKQLASNGRRA